MTDQCSEAPAKPQLRLNQGSSTTAMARLREGVVVFCLAWLLFSTMQAWVESYTADFNGHPDESSHYVTGVMVYEYFQRVPPPAPREFAVDYYLHYPKVGIGRWPPLFYLIFGAWSLVFGVGKFASFALLAMLAASVCASVYLLTVGLSGRIYGALAAATWALLPLTVDSVTVFMSEVLVTGLCVGAVLAYGRYLSNGSYKAAASFGLLAALALLSKGTAFSLAFTPPLAILLSRRFSLVKRFSFWLPVPMVLAIAGVWYVPLLRSAGARAIQLDHLAGPWERLSYWPEAGGVLVIAAALVGLWTRLLAPALRRGAQPWAAAAGSFLLVVAALHQLLPESQELRHLGHAIPFVVVFAVVGTADLIGRLAPKRSSELSRQKKVMIFAAVLALFCGATFRLSPKPMTPYGSIAETLLADPRLQGGVILVSSDRLVDGILIAEIALREPHPRRVILRATKSLAHVGTNAIHYRAAFNSSVEMSGYLTSIPVGAIVFDEPRPNTRFVHHQQLSSLAADPGSPWPTCSEYRASLQQRGDLEEWWVRSCLMEGDDLRQRQPIEIELDALGRTLRLEPPAWRE